MRKGMSLTLSILMALSLGLTLVYCGDNGDDDPCDGAECCAAEPCETGTCIDGECVTDPCPEQECCEGKPCTEGICADGVCEECCGGQESHGNVIGTVVEFGANTPVSVALALVGATNAMTSTTPTHLTETTSDANGAYETDCVDLTGQSLGMLMLADDTGFDGAAGTYYPTYSGVLSISGAADLTCQPEAPTAFAFPNTLIGLLSQIPGLATLADDGFALIFILDADMQQVAGAKLYAWDSNSCSDTEPCDQDAPCVGGKCFTDSLPVALYPSADLQDFTGTETSALGLVLVANLTSLSTVVPIKEGVTWESDLIGIVPGYCFTRPLIASE